MSEIKIWRMNDCDWYAGETLNDCIGVIAEEMGESKEDSLEYVQEPAELTGAEMDRLRLRDNSDCYPGMTYREALKAMIAEGVKFPCMFASTEF